MLTYGTNKDQFYNEEILYIVVFHQKVATINKNHDLLFNTDYNTL